MLTLRVRMPIVADLVYPRNFITKIIKYDKVCEDSLALTLLYCQENTYAHIDTSWCLTGRHSITLLHTETGTTRHRRSWDSTCILCRAHASGVIACGAGHALWG